MDKGSRRVLLVLVIVFGFITVYLIGNFTGTWMVMSGGNMGSLDTSTYDSLPSAPVLNDILPKTDTDGDITITWVGSERTWYYNIYRRLSVGGTETKIGIGVLGLSFTDTSPKIDGGYQYRIEAVNNIGRVFSNWETVFVEIPYPPPVVLPTNPTIIINSGALTTELFEVTLTLSCDNADEMHFQKSEGVWTDWEPYSTTYTLLLFDGDPYYPDYRVEVEFRNVDGTTKDAGYDNVYDEITYVELEELEEPEEPTPSMPPADGGDGGFDYTIMYIVVGVVAVLGVLVMFIQLRKRRKFW